MKIEELFFELIQVAIGQRERLSRNPTNKEWAELDAMSSKQSLTGVVFYGVEKLPMEQWPAQDILFQWMGDVSLIENWNNLTSKACQDLCRQLETDDFQCCIMKGQANHVYYPSELRNRRTCGDIDVWTVPKEGRRIRNATLCSAEKKEDVRKTLEYLKGKYELTGLCWLHANMTHESGVPVEVHFFPSFMNSPIKNRRFLKYFHDIKECTCLKDINGIQIPAMKIDYDVIYQMNHIYRHLIDEGVGLRQVLDYYMVLKAWHKEEGSRKKEGVMQTVRCLGMGRFASALMYVLQKVFAMPDEWLLCEPSEKHGRFLLNEIMMAGNFGHDDPRMASLNVKEGHLGYQISHAWRRIKRNMRFFTSYPEEVFWEPYARMSHFAWKKFIEMKSENG